MAELQKQSEGPQASLERAYLEQYLHGLGHSLESLKQLPEEQAHQLMRAASLYASAKLSQVEATSHLVAEMHGGAHPV